MWICIQITGKDNNYIYTRQTQNRIIACVAFCVESVFFLKQAGVKTTGTDEMRFVEILVSRSRSHLQRVFEEYKKVLYIYELNTHA